MFVGPTLAQSTQDKAIFWIQARVPTNQVPEIRTSTGFLLPSAGGIVTCLHNVLGADSIAVQDASHPDLTFQVQLSKVDLTKDLAVLSSPEMASRSDGFRAAENVELAKMDGRVSLPTFGVPKRDNSVGQSSFLFTRQPVLTPLSALVDAEDRRYLEKTNCPALSTQVLFLQGIVYPGQSGAPILDDQGRVLAVVNGAKVEPNSQVDSGKYRFTDSSWAIPIGKIVWQSTGQRNVKQKLEALATLRLTLSPDFDLLVGRPPSQGQITRAKARLVSPDRKSIHVSLLPPEDQYRNRSKEILGLMRMMYGESVANQMKKIMEGQPPTYQEYLESLPTTSKEIQRNFENTNFVEGVDRAAAVMSKWIDMNRPDYASRDGSYVKVPHGTQIEILEAPQPQTLSGGLLKLEAPYMYKILITNGPSANKIGWVSPDYINM